MVGLTVIDVMPPAVQSVIVTLGVIIVHFHERDAPGSGSVNNGIIYSPVFIKGTVIVRVGDVH